MWRVALSVSSGLTDKSHTRSILITYKNPCTYRIHTGEQSWLNSWFILYIIIRVLYSTSYIRQYVYRSLWVTLRITQSYIKLLRSESISDLFYCNSDTNQSQENWHFPIYDTMSSICPKTCKQRKHIGFQYFGTFPKPEKRKSVKHFLTEKARKIRLLFVSRHLCLLT